MLSDRGWTFSGLGWGGAALIQVVVVERERCRLVLIKITYQTHEEHTQVVRLQLPYPSSTCVDAQSKNKPQKVKTCQLSTMQKEVLF